MIVEWDVPFRLTSEAGTLLLNQLTPDVGYFVLNPVKCSTGLPPRVVNDDVPQGHGRIRHARWWPGYDTHLAVQMWETIGEDGQPACGQRLREMGDILARHINALMVAKPWGQGARLFWQPTGYGDERMLRDVQLAGGRTFDASQEEVEFDIDTELPYAMDSTETITEIADGTTELIDNPGSVDFAPVMKLHGPTGLVTVINNSVLDPDGNPLLVEYSDAMPGAVTIDGGDYVEVDHFRNTMILNGNSGDRDSGLNVEVSDYFPLVPGGNLVEAVGGDVTVLSNGAWA